MLMPARFFAMFLAIPFAWSQTPDVSWKGTWNRGFYTQLTHANASTLLALYENGLDVFAISETGPLNRLGRMELGTDKPIHVSVSQGMAVVLTETRVLLVDISNPQQPSLSSEIDEIARFGYMDGSRLFLFGQKLMHWDVSEPQTPELLFEQRVLEKMRAGFTFDGRLFTIRESGVIDVFNIAPDGRLVPRFMSIASSIAPAKTVAFGGNRFFLAHSEFIPNSIFTGIHAYKIEADGQVTHEGSVYPEMNIKDLLVFEDRLIAAVDSESFQGLIFYNPDFQVERFQEGVRLQKPQLEAIHAVNERLFFGVSVTQGLLQFRPETSYSQTTSFEQPALAQDAAFKDPYAYLASAGKIEVVSFKDPEAPELIATYPHNLFGSHKLLVRDNELYLSHSAGIRRYQIAADGSLALPDSFLAFGLDPVLAMERVGDRFYVATGRLFLEITPSGLTRRQFPPSIVKPAHNPTQVVINPPYVLKRSEVNLEWFSFENPGELMRINSLRLNLTFPAPPSPVTWNEDLLIAGSYIFDAEDVGNLRPLTRANTHLEDARVINHQLFGVGPNGFQIWDFQRPEAPQVLWERFNFAGHRIFQDGETLLIFNRTPNELSYFNFQMDETETFFPFLQNWQAGTEQLIVHNPCDQKASVSLVARFLFSENVEKTVEIPSFSTRTFNLSELFDSEEDLSLLIRSTSRIKTTFQRTGNAFSDGSTSPLLASPFDVASLTNRLSLNVPTSPTSNKIALASPDGDAQFLIQLQFLTSTGIVGEKEIAIDGKEVILGNVHQIFDGIQPGQAGTIVATSPEGTRIAGMVFAEERVDAEAANKGFPLNPQSANPLFTESLTRSAFGDQFANLASHEGDVLFAGDSGLLLATKDGETERPDSVLGVLDGALGEHYMWVLTNQTLDMRNRGEDKILSQIANEVRANRVRRQGDDFFLWNDEMSSLQIVTLTGNEQMKSMGSVSLRGAWPTDALRVGEQLMVATNQGLQVYQLGPSFKPNYLGTTMSDAEMGLLGIYEGLILAESAQKIVCLQPNPQGMPLRVSEREFDGALLAINQGKGLFWERRQFFSISKLTGDLDPQPLEGVRHNIVQSARFSDSRLWVSTERDGVYGYDIENPANPVLIMQIESNASFFYLAESDSRIFAAGRDGEDLIIGEIPPDGKVVPTDLLNLGEGFPTGIVAKGNYAYIGDARQGLITVRFDPQTGPRVFHREPGRRTGLVGNDKLLVTKDESTFKVYSLQNSIIPQLLSESPLPDRVGLGMALDGDYLLVTGDQSRFSVIDLTNRIAPQKLSELILSTDLPRLSIGEMAVANQHAYVLFGLRLVIVDYTNPFEPRVVDRIPTQAYRVQVIGEYLYLRDDLDSAVYDISNPKRPKFIGEVENMALGAAVLSGDTFWNGTDSALQSFRFSPVRATIPWVVNNPYYQTKIQIANLSAKDETLLLRGVNPQGMVQEASIALAANSTQEAGAEQLFAELSGHAVTVISASSQVNVSFTVLANLTDPQKLAVAHANATPADQLQDGLVFSFPDTATAAFAISAPFSKVKQPVRLQYFGPEGFVEERVIDLDQNRPAVHLVKALFSPTDGHESFTIIATSSNGSRLAGTTFVFNEEGLPAVEEAFPESTLNLKRNPNQD